jgi:phage-related protein
MKEVVFIDSALEEIRGFPDDARRQSGYQIDRVQRGELPTDWKPMSTIGPGVNEIRVHAGGEYRVIYVAKFAEAVYVLHGFHKTTQRTPKRNIDIAERRYRSLIAMRSRK